MNNHLKSDLIRDHVLKEARLVRRKRKSRAVLTILLPACVAVFAMWPSPEPSIAVKRPSPVEESEPFAKLSTDEELLDRLAHLGPVIVTREDGSQWLYLTNE